MPAIRRIGVAREQPIGNQPATRRETEGNEEPSRSATAERQAEGFSSMSIMARTAGPRAVGAMAAHLPPDRPHHRRKHVQQRPRTGLRGGREWVAVASGNGCMS